MHDRPGLLRPLGRPAFRSLLAGRTFAELGNAAAPIALAFAVLDLTGSVVDVGIVVGARSLANVVLVLFGGVLADRFPRALILRGTQLVAALTQGLIAAAIVLDVASVPLLVGLGVVNGAVAALFLPASASLTPQSVPPTLLVPANAAMRIGVNLGRITGAGIGGLLAAAAGPGPALAVVAVTFLAASVAFRGVAAPPPVRPGQPGRPGPLADLVEGWAEFRSTRWIRAVVLQFMVVNAITAGGLTVIGPTVADATFGRASWGLALAVQTLGALAGGAAAARWQPVRLLRHGVGAAVLLGLPLLGLALHPRTAVLLAAMFVAGFALEQFVVAWEVSLQQHVEQDKLARIYSYDALGSYVALPIGEIAAGPVSSAYGVGPTLLGGAAAVLAATAVAVAVPGVRRLHRTDV